MLGKQNLLKKDFKGFNFVDYGISTVAMITIGAETIPYVVKFLTGQPIHINGAEFYTLEQAKTFFLYRDLITAIFIGLTAGSLACTKGKGILSLTQHLYQVFR